MTMEVNWGDVVSEAEEAAKPIPPGPYLLTVEAADWAPSKKGNPMMKIRYRIEGGQQNGKALFHYMVLSDNANGKMRFVNDVKAHGLDPANFAGLTDDQLEGLFMGKQVEADVIHDGEWNGKPQERIESMKPAGSAGDAPPPPPKESKAKSKAKAAEAESSDAPPPPKPMSDDD